MKRGWIAALLLALTACGGGSDGSDGSAKAGADDESAAIREAAQAYSDAYLTGDADAAYGLLSQRCQDRTPADQFASVVQTAKAQYGSALDFKSFDADVNGEQARVTYTYDTAAINQDQEPWVKESGEWREDDC
ncbi:hypothetical protein [Nocardioides sp. URHA0032]|uniref:hypothetical protein n=1 Tax=Nocardioides sp. URHA0032 TaxID=1380388 RepID=UPI00048C9692|nr:hypothetical protein [Nocardioides sp. URHA0032]